MDKAKEIKEKEKREAAAEDVTVRLSSTTTKGFAFNVYGNTDEKLKYIGEISKDHLADECTCSSFMFGNNEDYKKTHPLPFQCKHIMAAHMMMEGLW
ncbi:MAG: hypothetical protein ACR2P9_08695 [Gammaproteobacteria bacterium]